MPDPSVLGAPAEAEIVEKRSRFIAMLAPAPTVADADAVIAAARAAHPSARHHCTAMIIDGPSGPVQRSNDDGEPGGTAGMPMLMALRGAGLTDVVAVVIRYFGGIKLGTGGLARAYTDAVQAALSEATLLRRTEFAVFEIDVPHAEAGAAENSLRIFADAHGGTVEPAAYSADGATLTVLLEPDRADALAADVAAWSAGRLTARRIGSRVADIPFA